MALQDLTPQLRTRLTRMERAVGWFVILALALLTFGFVYYVYHTAERKGWFKTKVPFFTFTDRATGLKVGDPVQLMGFDVGQITRIDAQPPYDPYNVYVEFEILEPYDGYLWSEGSRARVNTADLLGKRILEVTKGTNGYPAYVYHSLRLVSLPEAEGLVRSGWVLGQEVWDAANHEVIAKALRPVTNLTEVTAAITAAIAHGDPSNVVVLNPKETRKFMTGIWNYQLGRYDRYTPTNKPYWLESDESPAVTERLDRIVSQVEHALPGILTLTNQLITVLSNSANLTSNLNHVAVTAQPVVQNLAAATAQLDRPGALGEWLLSTNVTRQLETTLTNASGMLVTAQTNLTTLAENLSRSLDNLASLTSNLNRQVEANTNLLSAISQTIVNADQFIQGLRRHWLLRSAFKPAKTNAPSAIPSQPVRSPKATGGP